MVKYCVATSLRGQLSPKSKNDQKHVGYNVKRTIGNLVNPLVKFIIIGGFWWQTHTRFISSSNEAVTERYRACRRSYHDRNQINAARPTDGSQRSSKKG